MLFQYVIDKMLKINKFISRIGLIYAKIKRQNNLPLFRLLYYFPNSNNSLTTISVT